MNLTLHSREARGAPQNPWFYVGQAKSNLPESDLNSTLAHLYVNARTYFIRNY